MKLDTPDLICGTYWDLAISLVVPEQVLVLAEADKKEHDEAATEAERSARRAAHQAELAARFEESYLH